MRVSGEPDLRELEAVDWNTCRTAFGHASDFPDLIRSAASPYSFQESVDALLDECFCADNGFFPCCLPTFPFFMQLLAIDLHERQEHLIWWLAIWIADIKTNRLWTQDGTIEQALLNEFKRFRDVFKTLENHSSPYISIEATKILQTLDLAY
ncbi:MAG: hypothetical protein AAFX06_31025 [Planctomycetota bacterium]